MDKNLDANGKPLTPNDEGFVHETETAKLKKPDLAAIELQKRAEKNRAAAMLADKQAARDKLVGKTAA